MGLAMNVKDLYVCSSAVCLMIVYSSGKILMITSSKSPTQAIVQGKEESKAEDSECAAHERTSGFVRKRLITRRTIYSFHM